MAMRGEKMQSEVLGVLRQHFTPLTAYDVLEELRSAHPKLAPPTIYNALSALTKKGKVHRLESLKAYIACQCDRHNHVSIMAICDECGKVEERAASTDLLGTVSSLVGETGFRPKRHIIEIHGVCDACSSIHEQEEDDIDPNFCNSHLAGLASMESRQIYANDHPENGPCSSNNHS